MNKYYEAVSVTESPLVNGFYWCIMEDGEQKRGLHRDGIWDLGNYDFRLPEYWLRPLPDGDVVISGEDADEIRRILTSYIQNTDPVSIYDQARWSNAQRLHKRLGEISKP